MKNKKTEPAIRDQHVKVEQNASLPSIERRLKLGGIKVVESESTDISVKIEKSKLSGLDSPINNSVDIPEEKQFEVKNSKECEESNSKKV